MSDIKKGSKYYVEGSDLLIHVLNVAYSGGGYIKARLRISNRYVALYCLAYIRKIY